MKESIKIFENPQFGKIRIAMTESNEPVFCTTDVCKALGYINSRKAIADHTKEDDVTKRDTTSSSGIKQKYPCHKNRVTSLIF